MIYEVIKRDGSVVMYDIEKIAKAISGAFSDFNKEFDDVYVLDLIEDKLNEAYSRYATVEDIQDIIEDALIECGYVDEAKAYIRYRYDHELARKQKLEKAIEEKLLASNIENQNANIDEHSFGGRKGEADSVFMKQYALDHCMSKKSKENHLNNDI